MLRNHGVVVVDESLGEALAALNILNIVCKMLVETRRSEITLKGISPEQVQSFLEKEISSQATIQIRRRLSSSNPFCQRYNHALFTVQKMEVLLQELKNYVCRDFRDIPAFKYHVGDVPGAEKIDFDDSGWEDFQVGGLWGGYDVTAWFQAQVPIPSGWENQRLALRFLVGPRDDGNPLPKPCCT